MFLPFLTGCDIFPPFFIGCDIFPPFFIGCDIFPPSFQDGFIFLPDAASLEPCEACRPAVRAELGSHHVQHTPRAGVQGVTLQ